MRCVECSSAAVTERPERTAQGYRRFRCRSGSIRKCGVPTLPLVPRGGKRHPPAASTRVRDRRTGDPAHLGGVSARCPLKWKGSGIMDDETQTPGGPDLPP